MRITDFISYYLWEIYCVSRGESKKEAALYKALAYPHLALSFLVILLILPGSSLLTGALLYILSTVIFLPMACWCIHSWVFARAERKVSKKLQLLAESGQRPHTTHSQMLEDATIEFFDDLYDTAFGAILTGLAILLTIYAIIFLLIWLNLML